MVSYLILNKQKKIEFVNDCNAIVNYGELKKAILWYSPKPTARVKHIYMHGIYPAISIYEEKMHIHRLLMTYWLQCKLPSNYYVHHIDENKLNALQNNLLLVFSSTHQSKHNKGKRVSDETRKLIAYANKKRKGKRQKKHRQDVSTQIVINMKNSGMSINAIALKLGCDWSTVNARIQDFENPELLGGDCK